MSDDLANTLGSQEAPALEFKQSGKQLKDILATRLTTWDDERVLAENRRSFDGPFDARPLPGASLADLDLNRFRATILPAFVAPDVIEENGRSIEQQLASLRITDVRDVPTALGLLLVGLDPSNYLPGAYIQFVRYSGTGADDIVVDAQEIRGNVADAAGILEDILRGHRHTPISSTGGFREQSQPEYPLDALREIGMNAIIHRNYETSNAPIRVVWFDDRIEVTNPGGPFGQVRPDNFHRVNDYRNPSLAGAMKSLGYVNRFGRGIERIQATLRRNGNPMAEFTVDNSSWTVVVRRPV